MAMSVVGVFPILIMLLMGGGAGLPLGLPPLPEDPLLARVAPAECLVYTSWSGTATPSDKSKNQTEQLLAEPEVQEMLRQIERAIVAGVDKNSAPQQAAITPRCDPLGQEAAHAARGGVRILGEDRTQWPRCPRRPGDERRRGRGGTQGHH